MIKPKHKKPQFMWDEKTGVAVCILQGEYGTFSGEASCHPDDQDMMSEKVGCEIAYSRAMIESLLHIKNNIIKPSLGSLKQLQYSMKHSKKFNPKSYESKMLWGQIQNWEDDLATINAILATERKMLRNYIQTKELFYQSIRKQRNGGQK